MLGTKKQSQLTIKSAAEKSKSQYVISRWLGGTLTNFDTIFKRIKHLNELENQQNNKQSTIPTKKEQLLGKTRCRMGGVQILPS